MEKMLTNENLNLIQAGCKKGLAMQLYYETNPSFITSTYHDGGGPDQYGIVP